MKMCFNLSSMYNCVGGFRVVKSMIPEIVVPDLRGFDVSQ